MNRGSTAAVGFALGGLLGVFAPEPVPRPPAAQSYILLNESLVVSVCLLTLFVIGVPATINHFVTRWE